jgi:hypothetical protein
MVGDAAVAAADDFRAKRRTLSGMVYRQAGVVEFCAVCAVETRRACLRCQRPCCAGHLGDRGTCASCEVERRERWSLRVARAVFVAVGAAASGLLAMAMIGSGMAVVVSVIGVVAMLLAATWAQQRPVLAPGRRPRATLPRP